MSPINICEEESNYTDVMLHNITLVLLDAYFSNLIVGF